ncbi:MAG: hypothetical protein ACREE2_12300 [Stellaceae bacterium]
MKCQTIGSKLLIATATALALVVVGPSEATAAHGGGWHGGGWHGGGWHEAGGWHRGAPWHDRGGHLGWYRHGWRRPERQRTFALSQFGYRRSGPGFVGPGAGWWDWRRTWGWSDFGRAAGSGAWVWGGLLAGASFGVVVAPPLIVAPPPIYIAPPPIVVGLPVIYPAPIAAAASPLVAAAAPPPPSTGALLGAALPPPIVILPPPAIVVAAAPPFVIVAPPAFALFIGPPAIALATIGPSWWTDGYITGGFAAIGASVAIAPFSHRRAGFVRASVGFHGRPDARYPWARGWGGHWPEARWGHGFGSWRGGGWHGPGSGGWHEARGSGRFGGRRGRGR